MKKIPMKHGRFVMVDDEDFEEMSKYKWSTSLDPKHHYAKHTVYYPDGTRKTLRMHRLIMKAPNGVWVDHINGNGLDNRKENLRLCSPSENARNCRLGKGNTSGFKGVYLVKGKWRGEIKVNKTKYHLGTYKNKIDAAKAYDQAAKKYFGEFAKLNFNNQ